jgi:hypothetical protein
MKLPSLINIYPLILASVVLGSLPARADVSGTWTWSSEGFWGQAMDATLTLTEKDGALSGSFDGGFGKSEIEGKADGGVISFQYTRSFGDREITSKFSGKLDDKLLKGTIALEGLDEPRSAGWKAYRTPEIDPSGLWKWQTTSGRDGAQQRDSWVKLRFGEEGLSGSYRTSRGQSPISDATLEGKEISFKVERRWGDRSFATNYKGTLSDKGIAGKISSRRNDEDRVVDWAASRDIPDVEPIGSWSWKSRRGRDGEESESKFTVVKDGDGLKGTFTGRGGESPIEDAKLEGDVLSFKVSFENDRGTFTSNYSGKIDEDAFQGQAATKFGEREFKRKVVANRVLPPAKPEGTWTWSSRRGRDGDSVENKLVLIKSDDGKLAGTLARGDEAITIGDVAIDGNQISFKLQRTFRDNPVTLRYSGQIRGDKIKGGYRFGETEGGYETFWNAERGGG